MEMYKVIGALKQFAIWFTMIYIWTASCIYLAYNVNSISANACFYGGITVAILWFIDGIIRSKRV